MLASRIVNSFNGNLSRPNHQFKFYLSSLINRSSFQSQVNKSSLYKYGKLKSLSELTGELPDLMKPYRGNFNESQTQKPTEQSTEELIKSFITSEAEKQDQTRPKAQGLLARFDKMDTQLSAEQRFQYKPGWKAVSLTFLASFTLLDKYIMIDSINKYHWDIINSLTNSICSMIGESFWFPQSSVSGIIYIFTMLILSDTISIPLLRAVAKFRKDVMKIDESQHDKMGFVESELVSFGKAAYLVIFKLL